MTVQNHSDQKPELQAVNNNQAATLASLSLVTLVKISQEGNLDAFGKLVERFEKMALAMAYYRLGDYHQAQDVAQEAFVEAYLNLTKLLEAAAFPGWFRKIVLKRIDRVTRVKPIPLLGLTEAESIAAPASDPLQQLETRESSYELFDLIEQLPNQERTVFVLFYLNDYSQNEIVSFLEIPLTTVKKRLFSGRQHLKESLGNPQFQPVKKRKTKKGSLPEKIQFLLAVRAGNLKMVEALLNKDPALMVATEEWDEEISRQFYVPMAQGQTALWRATHNGQLEMVELLLAKSKGLKQPVPFEEAVLMGHLKIAEILIRARADVNKPLQNGLTLMTIAVIREDEAMVKLLLAHGAKVNCQSRGKLTPLHWSSLKGNPSITKHLLAAGADPFIRDEAGLTPLELAQKPGKETVLKEFEPFIRPD